MIVIEFPFPNSILNPNRSKGTHWATTSKLRKDARDDAFWLTKKAAGTGVKLPDGDIELYITFVQPDKRQRDRDNLLAALKPTLDGMADALSVNDSRFEPITIRREFGSKPGMVRVAIGKGMEL